MHPILSDRRRFLVYLIAWMMTGVLIARLLVAADLANWSFALLFSLPLALFGSFLTSSAYFVCRSIPFNRRSFSLAALVFAGAALISGLSWLGLCYGWNRVLVLASDDVEVLHLSSHLLVLFFITGFAVYLLALLAFDVYIAFDNIREAERREAASRLLARDAELQVLRSQIDPHFLFNSLNSISALTAIDATAARTMTIALADFFRQTLAIAEKEKISLKDELRLCENFLAVEKIRFGKKLDTEFEVTEEAENALIPPMILQPLLENAIKHGIRNLPKGGLIKVTIFQREGWLHIAVENPVSAEPGNSTGNGLGLVNLRQRFFALYGEQARVSWQRGDEKFTLEMALPFEPNNQTQ
ncbi:sensor histidine kinase [Undibacterium sp. TC4M20W]|uniref:sensor histidine kinase n=1 Tax=Undibacterium sp. TC4M20W TaxID=3413052 RepID=UPI003BF37C84